MNAIFSSLGKFLALSISEKSLLFLAVALRIVLSVGLWFLSFETVKGLLSRVTEKARILRTRPGLSVDRIGWIVGASDRLFPASGGCLTRAMTAKLLLALEGHPCQLQIGVARDGKGRLEGHAWLECDGNILFAGRDSDRFVLMRRLGE
jgi:Transglutaminase-like superfamily